MNSLFKKLLFLLTLFFTSILFADDANIEIHITDVTANESDGTMTFTISLSEAPIFPVSIDFKTIDGSAEAGSDYVMIDDYLLFGLDVSSRTFTVDLIDDNQHESTETFYIDLSSSSSGYVSNYDGTGSIKDDDADNSLKVEASCDDADEGASSESNNIECTISLNRTLLSTESDLTIHYNSADGDDSPSAKAGEDYQSITGDVTFHQGETEKTIYIPTIGDDEIEEDESVKLVISGSSYITDAQGDGWIINDDGSYPGISFTHNEFSLIEGNSSTKMLDFNFTLSEPAVAGASFTYDTWDGSAEDDAKDNDYIWTHGEYNITTGAKNFSISVPINGDIKIEKDEYFHFGIDNLKKLSYGIIDEAKGTIINDDGSYPIISVDHDTFSTSEGNTSQKTLDFTFTLNKPALKNSSFKYYTQHGDTDGNDYVEIPSTSYIFKGGEKNITISVVINGDTEVETDEKFNIYITDEQNLSISGTRSPVGIIENDDYQKSPPFEPVCEDTFLGAVSSTKDEIQINVQTKIYGTTNHTLITKKLAISEPVECDDAPCNKSNTLANTMNFNLTLGNGGDGDKILVDDSTLTISSDKEYKKFQTGQNNTITINGDLILKAQSDFYINANSKININGDVIIYADKFDSNQEGIFNINGSLTIICNIFYLNSGNNLQSIPNPQSFVVLAKDIIDINSQVEFKGLFYSDGDIQINDRTIISGALTGNYIDINDQVTINYDSDAVDEYCGVTVADNDPFTCDSSMYISSSIKRGSGTSGKMWLHKIDTTQNPFAFNVLDDEGETKLYNALAYADSGDANISNYIFGLYKKKLVKLTRTGKVIELGKVDGLPDILTKKQLFAGAIYNGYYYISGPGVDYDKIFKIRLSDKSVSEISLNRAISLLDFSFTPDGKFLHGIIDGGELVKINVATGIVTTIGTAHTGYQFDSTFSDKNGRFFANDSLGNGFFEFDLKNGKKHFLSASQKAEFNDGANCLNAKLSFMDYGDAPISYGKTWHSIANDIYLGENVDHDIGDFDTIGADGDDKNGIDDEDGVVWADGRDINGSYFGVNQTHELNVTLSKEGYLKIWIDTDINGHFDNFNDLVYNTGNTLTAGTHTINISLPDGLAKDKTTYLRARVSSQANLNPVGYVTDGEVEDYAIKFGTKFKPLRGKFNVERTDSVGFNIMTDERNAWYTQIVGRDFDYSLVFYNESFTKEQNISKIAAKIELVDTKSDNPLYERYIYIAENAAKSRFTFDSKNSPTDDLSEQSKSSFPPIPASKDVHFRVTYPKDSSGNIIQSECLTDAKTCFNTLTETKTDDARNELAHFAIRPDNYYVTINDGSTERVNSQNTPASIRLASGYDYNLTTTATRYMTATPATGYTTTINEEFDFNTTGTCASTKPIKLSLNFTDGKFNSKTFSHDNVGKYILDINDSNWTNIDQNSTLFGCIKNSSTRTADDKGRVGCNISIYLNSIEMIFYPDHFNVELNLLNLPDSNHTDFIYMMELNETNDNVAIAFDGNITAQNENNTSTTNFTTGCVATNILLDLNATTVSVEGTNQDIFTTDNITAVNFSRVIRFNGETNSNNFDVNNTIRRISNTFPISSDKFLNDKNGTMTLDMRYNLNKNIRQAINPVEVTFNNIDVNSADANSSAHQIINHIPSGTQTFINNVKNFYFARVVSDLNNYPRVNINISPLVRTPLNVDIYCGTTLANYCIDRNVIANSNISGTTREQNGWYISARHNGDLDGNVTGLVDNPNILTITPNPTPIGADDISLNNGTNGTVNEVFNNCSQPSSTITITTDPVLAFEPSQYTVNCTKSDPSQWTGIGKTGNVLKVQPKVDKSGKMDW